MRRVLGHQGDLVPTDRLVEGVWPRFDLAEGVTGASQVLDDRSPTPDRFVVRWDGDGIVRLVGRSQLVPLPRIEKLGEPLIQPHGLGHHRIVAVSVVCPGDAWGHQQEHGGNYEQDA